MSFIRRIFGVDPQTNFEKGKTAFEKNNFKSAFKFFQKAYLRFDTEEMNLLALDNAALSAEKAKLYENAAELYYQQMLRITANNKPIKEIFQSIDRVLQMIRLSKKSNIPPNELRYIQFLIYLSEKNFEKLTSIYESNKKSFTDSYGKALATTWTLIHSSDTFVEHESLPTTAIPEEFSNLKLKAEEIMQRCSLCKSELFVADKSQIIEKGLEFQLSSTLTAHAPISINSIFLKTGSHGRLISTTTPELPLNLSTGENYTINYSLIPNLPGKWKIGPLIVTYGIPHEEGEYPSNSNKFLIEAKDAEPALNLNMESETIEEDSEYLVTVIVENIGKISLQNTLIKIDIPEGVKISQGTEEKLISSLAEGETFSFEIEIKFDLEQTHFDGRVIKTQCFIGEQHRLAKSSIKLGGR
ncbi:hypothetical protein CEE45_09290 [Candidatus Heimdallarchaeota archaeon B3_Heim]|nr:MAG: hypothetical protein CEE45_09290 [Candidatus Heimdallarchaeota archaeon B3_Heim]